MGHGEDNIYARWSGEGRGGGFSGGTGHWNGEILPVTLALPQTHAACYGGNGEASSGSGALAPDRLVIKQGACAAVLTRNRGDQEKASPQD